MKAYLMLLLAVSFLCVAMEEKKPIDIIALHEHVLNGLEQCHRLRILYERSQQENAQLKKENAQLEASIDLMGSRADGFAHRLCDIKRKTASLLRDKSECIARLQSKCEQMEQEGRNVGLKYDEAFAQLCDEKIKNMKLEKAYEALGQKIKQLQYELKKQQKQQKALLVESSSSSEEELCAPSGAEIVQEIRLRAQRSFEQTIRITSLLCSIWNIYTTLLK